MTSRPGIPLLRFELGLEKFLACWVISSVDIRKPVSMSACFGRIEDAQEG